MRAPQEYEKSAHAAAQPVTRCTSGEGGMHGIDKKNYLKCDDNSKQRKGFSLTCGSLEEEKDKTSSCLA